MKEYFSSKLDLPYIKQSFYFNHSNGRRIYCELYTPNDSNQLESIVILSHGFMSSCFFLKGYAENLTKHGIGCCLFDFCGGSTYSRSDGSMLDMSIITQIEDFKLVFNGLKATHLNVKNFYIGGESQGGLVAALTATKISSDIEGTILLYPAMYIPEVMRKKFPNRHMIPDQFLQLGVMLGRRYADDVYEMDAYEQIKKYEGKTLILHGTNDSMVPLSYSQKAQKVYSNAKLVILPGATHGIYDGQSLEQACDEIIKFVKNGNERSE